MPRKRNSNQVGIVNAASMGLFVALRNCVLPISFLADTGAFGRVPSRSLTADLDAFYTEQLHALSCGGELLAIHAAGIGG
jgi:hypothetical protein